MRMNKYGITKDNLLRTFPEALSKDENMLALATITANELALRPSEISLLKIYSRIDELPEDLLDILAYDFKVDWWDYNYSLKEKRQTLKDSWAVHRSLGTPGAVEKAISAIYPNTQVSEWFEYAGEPYHFKILIDVTYESVDPVKHQRAIDRIQIYKNRRSHSDGIEYIYVPVGNCRGYGATTLGGMRTELTVEVAVYGMG